MSDTAQNNELSSINDIIKLIKSIEEDIIYSAYIPSLKKEIKFKQLSTEQLTQLLKSVVDSPIYNTNFILTFNELIKETCIDEAAFDGLTILDKVYIFLACRIENISNIYEIRLTDNEVDELDLDNNVCTYNLQTILKKHLDITLNETYTHNNITIICSLPTLITENKFENDLHKNTKIELNTPTDLQELIGSTFINEITKFISKININNTDIDLTKLTFLDRVKIIEQLPTPLVNKVILYIESFKTAINNILTIDIDIKNKQDNTVTISKLIPFDASFFNN